jgi:hypothetical protein
MTLEEQARYVNAGLRLLGKYQSSSGINAGRGGLTFDISNLNAAKEGATLLSHIPGLATYAGNFLSAHIAKQFVQDSFSFQDDSAGTQVSALNTALKTLQGAAGIISAYFAQAIKPDKKPTEHSFIIKFTDSPSLREAVSRLAEINKIVEAATLLGEETQAVEQGDGIQLVSAEPGSTIMWFVGTFITGGGACGLVKLFLGIANAAMDIRGKKIQQDREILENRIIGANAKMVDIMQIQHRQQLTLYSRYLAKQFGTPKGPTSDQINRLAKLMVDTSDVIAKHTQILVHPAAAGSPSDKNAKLTEAKYSELESAEKNLPQLDAGEQAEEQDQEIAVETKEESNES